MTFILKAFYFFGLLLMFRGSMSHQPSNTELPNQVLLDLKQDTNNNDKKVLQAGRSHFH